MSHNNIFVGGFLNENEETYRSQLKEGTLEDVYKFKDIDGTLNFLAQFIRTRNEQWWSDFYGNPIERNVGELLMLMVSELAEAMEGDRKNLMDDKLPHRKMIEVELADCLIRILDFAGGKNLDIGRAFVEKMEYNLHREDHKKENRMKENGKKY